MSELNGRLTPHWSLTAGQILVGLVLAGMLFVMHQMYWPIKVMEVTKVEVLTPTVVAGERVKIRFTVEKYMMVPMTIQRTLVNETTTTYIEEHGSQPLGKSVKTVELLIPKDKHEGKYHISSTVIAKANHFRTWQKTWETPWFWVSNPESQNTEKIKAMQKDIIKMEKAIDKNNTKMKGIR
jgi:hypothetical protein